MKNKILSFVIAFLGSVVVWSQSPNWSVNPSDYQYSMTITAFLTANGTPLTNTNDKVGAFVGNQARGEANIVYNAKANKYLAYLTLYSNTEGETINFKIFDSKTNSTLAITKTEKFIIDAHLGGVLRSYSIANPPLQQVAEMASFSFKGITEISSNIATNQITIVLPKGTAVTNLIPEFSTKAKGKVYVNGKVQTSGNNTVDFTNAVNYEVVSEDEQKSQTYTVNVSVASTSNPITAVISTSESISNVKVVTATIDFSNDVSGLTKEKFLVKNGVIKTLTTISNRKFNIEIVVQNQGKVSIQLPANTVFDLDNNGNLISNELKVTYDIQKPIVKEIVPNGNVFTVEFSEEVTNVTKDDFELKGVAKEGYEIASLQAVSPSKYTISLNNLETHKGNVFVVVKQINDIKDIAENTLEAQVFEMYYNDNESPKIPVLEDVVANCSVNVETIPTTTDNYSGIVKGTTTDTTVFNTPGNYQINWTFTDKAGNTTTASQKVIVKNVNTFTLPTLKDVVGQCSVTITEIPIAYTSCSSSVKGTTTDTLTYATQGEYTITWSFDDGNGNSGTAQQKVIVKDTEAPIVVVKNIEIDLQGATSKTITVADIEGTISDNCGVDTKELSKTDFSTSDIGENIIKLTVVDINKNVITKDIVVTVKDESLSTEVFNLNSEIRLYPNPVSDFLQINSQNYLIKSVVIFDINGREMFSKTINSLFFKKMTSNFSKGIYFVKIITEKGELTKKIIKN